MMLWMSFLAGLVPTWAAEEKASSNTMSEYKSALAWLYCEKRLKLGAELNCYIDDFVKGYKKQIAEKKLRGVMKLNKGKSILQLDCQL